MRAELERHRGREVKTMGDGFLATFDGPARGIRCARAIADQVRALDIELRAGLHTGECELIGDDIGGMAVNIGARIGALAGADEVVVSSTVKDLVVGSGISFSDRGTRELKGVPGEWRQSLPDEGARHIWSRGLPRERQGSEDAMIRHIRDLDATSAQADVCIIGSGAAGLTVALELDATRSA